MGYVMPTLFVMGFGYFVTVTSLDRPLPSMRLAWIGFWLIMAGVIMAMAPVLAGKATVLYTFYPPLTGSVFYYLGLVLVVVGSWFWVALMIWTMSDWKKDNPGKPVPLAMFGQCRERIPVVVDHGRRRLRAFVSVNSGRARLDADDGHRPRPGRCFAWTLHPIV